MSGFLLATDRYRGRLVERFGAGVWVGNWVLDRFIREPEERLTGEAASTDLSNDLYRQLSQLVFNARMRQEALQLQAPVRTRRRDDGVAPDGIGVFSILFPAWTAPGVFRSKARTRSVICTPLDERRG